MHKNEIQEPKEKSQVIKDGIHGLLFMVSLCFLGMAVLSVFIGFFTASVLKWFFFFKELFM